MPWQNGIAEHHGRMWKVAFQKALLELEVTTRGDIKKLTDRINEAHNGLTRVHGLSPSQHVLGSDVCMPGLIMTGELDEVSRPAMQGERGFEHRIQVRCAARSGLMCSDSKAKIRKSLYSRTDTTTSG